MLVFAISSISALVVSMAIFLRNPKGKLHRYYLLFTLSIILWLTGVLLAETPDSLFEAHFRFLFTPALTMTIFLFLFINELTENKIKKSVLWLIILVSTSIALLSQFTPYITEKVEISAKGAILPTRGFLYFPATLWILGIAIYSIIILTNYIRSTRKDSKRRRQSKVVVIGLVLAVGNAGFSNILFPALTGDTSYSNYAPFSLMFISFGMGYAIVKHRLFDIRAAIARSLAYISSVFILVTLFVGSITVISGETLFARSSTTTEKLLYISLAIATAMLYQPLKKFFDRATNWIFYQDAYEPQDLLNDLNNTLVNATDLEVLLTKSALIIQEQIKTSYCTFYVRDTAYFPERVFGAKRKTPEISDIKEIQKESSNIKSKIYTTQIEPNTATEKKVSSLLQKNDFDVMVRLVETLDFAIPGVGFIFLGPKRSGALYSDQDLKVLEIIANELVIAVENALRLEEIEQFNVTLQKKIDEATKELKQSNEKLKALDEAKDEFVSMASHQLRTPLTSIKGYLSMVLEGDAGKLTATQKQMLGQAFFSSQRMVYLISDLLNVSRLKTGKFIIEPKEVNLPNLVEDEIEQLQEGAKAKDITLAFVKPKEFSMVELDEMKIRQVVMNFVDNGIYYTPSGEKITVDLKETDKTIEFTVKDSGIGVPKKQQHKLFTKFYRADNARKARPDGTGLGLFMAKKVIVAQGGSIIFKSTEGKGSTFGFSFPKKKIEVKS